MASGRPCADTHTCVYTDCGQGVLDSPGGLFFSENLHHLCRRLPACGRHSPVCAQSKQHLDGPPSSLRGHPNGGAYELSAPGLEHSVSCLALPAVTRSLHVLRDTRAHGGHHLTLVRSSCDVAFDGRERRQSFIRRCATAVCLSLFVRGELRSPLSHKSLGDMSDSIGHVSKHGPRSIACVQV